MAKDATRTETECHEFEEKKLECLLRIAAMHQTIIDLGDRVRAFQRTYDMQHEDESVATGSRDCSG